MTSKHASASHRYWVIKKGKARMTARGDNIDQARERAAFCGFGKPDSITLVTDAERDLEVAKAAKSPL